LAVQALLASVLAPLKLHWPTAALEKADYKWLHRQSAFKSRSNRKVPNPKNLSLRVTLPLAARKAVMVSLDEE
jgi:hypothetical protein